MTRSLIAALALVCASATTVQAQPTPRHLADPAGIHFERNVGQAPADAQFIAHGSGYALMLTRGGGVVRGTGHRDVRIVFPGGDMTSLPLGEAPAPGVVNYLVGNDPSRWRTNIVRFDRVRYPRVYPGVDVVYHASQGQMEYDIVLDPGADPARLRMRFEGADRVTLEGTGDLTVHINDRILTVQKPVLYQGKGDSRRPVDGAFVRFANGDIGFDVGRYDTQAPLVIDPVLVYSSLLPQRVESIGSQPAAHVPAAIAVGADGATYIMGTISMPFAGFTQNDIFIAKVNPSGSTLAFTTYLGGVATEVAKALALGPSGEVYLAGQTSSYDFPAVSAAQAVFGGQTDGFLVKLSPTGDALEYATLAGGSDEDLAEAVVVDADAHAYLVGSTRSADFPLLSSPATHAGSADVFVVKYDAAGTKMFSILLGGQSFDEAHAAHLAPDGALIIAGEAGSPTFPTTAGAFQTVSSGSDAFVTRLSTVDGHVLQSTFLGGTSFDRIRDVETDPSGAVYVTGETFSMDFPTTAGVVQPTHPGIVGLTNGFVTKLTVDLGALAYSTFLGGSDVDRGSSIAVDALGRAVVTGPSSSPNFPQFSPLFPLGGPSFITKLSANGSQFVYSTRWPATITAVTLGLGGDAYVTGTTTSATYPITGNALAVPAGGLSTRGVLSRISDASPACSYELKPSVVVVPSSNSTQSISVVAPSECFWTATSDDPSWLAPTTTNGTGTGTVTFSTTNATSGIRSATITVGNGGVHQTLTVYQGVVCDFLALPSVPVQPDSGGPVVVSFTGAAACPWTAVTDAPWITVAPVIDFLDVTGQGQVTLTLAPNTSIAGRSATVYIGTSGRNGWQLHVQQAGRCTTSLSPSSFTAHRTGGIAAVTVTVAPADCQWTARASEPWLVPSLSNGVGSQTIQVTVGPSVINNRSGRLVIAGQTFTVNQSGPAFSSTPSVYPPLPPAGSGRTQTFAFTFYDQNGATKLDVVNVLINDFLDGGSACYLAYARAINVLYLVNDPGNALLPGLVLDGGAQSVGNSQCAIDGGASSAVVNGNVLRLTLRISFSDQFAGDKVVYQAARNVTGFNSGWVQQGVWNVPSQTAPPLQVVSMTTSRNAGTAYPLQFTFRDLDGADDLVSTSVLINSYLDGFRACYLGYHVPTNAILLLNDAGNGYIGSLVLGTNATIENSQCRIRAQESGAVANGTDLTLTLMIEFKAGFVGDRVFYVSAQDEVGTSGWQAVGSWTVP